METLSRRFVNFMIENNIIPEQDKEIYRFGFVLMLRIMLNVLTLLFIGACFNMIGESIAFVVCSLMIRSYSGGFHSDNPIICYLISVAAIILMLFSIKLGIWNISFSFILIALSIGVILRYAPVEHKNKPLEEIERKTYRKRLLIVILAMVLISIFLTLAHCYFILFAISFALSVSAIMILVCKK